MKSKIVHIVSNEKFIKPFIELVNENFDSSEHLFLNIKNKHREKFPLPQSDNVIEFKVNLNKNIILLWKEINGFLKNADKIIVHGAFSGSFMKYLYFSPTVLAKAYWVMWGADLYKPLTSPANTLKKRISRTFDNKVKKGFAGYVTYIPGDYELAKKLYGATGRYHECIMYPSNVYSQLILPDVLKDKLLVMVGNSADIVNNHVEVFQKLSALDDQNFNIICPLSYGNKAYADKMKRLGESMFGSRFKALVDFIPFDEYLNILAGVDIAIFNHKRQQAMGNTITLLGLGKTIYMRNDVTPFALFKELDIQVRDINSLELNPMNKKVIEKNIQNIKRYFSEENLIKQLHNIFEE